MREHIVMPLLTIQQFASSQIIAMRKSQTVDEKLLNVYEILVSLSLFGNTNASRNSA
jgi:phosphoenolpyruvate carboxylase